MISGVFITGTDTEVGKTVVAAGLALTLRERGVRVGVMKPVATGCHGTSTRLISQDAVFLLEAAENEFPALTSPLRFRNPLAPCVAANLEKREIDVDDVRRAYQKLRSHYDFMIVEGIGGLLVPISKDYFVSHLIRELGLPVVITAHARLGTINHTLLTVDAALVRGFDVRGIIFNRMSRVNYSLAEMTNPKIIQELSHVPVLGSLPEMPDVDVDSCRFGRLKEVFKERIQVDRILESQPVHLV